MIASNTIKHALIFMSLLLLFVTPACSTINTARPLQPGEHMAGITAGGAMLRLGEIPLTLPNTVCEGRHGLVRIKDRSLDVGYGLNLTGFAFGLLQGHLGSAFLVLDQNGALPAISISNRLYFATTLPWLADREDSLLQTWSAHHLELTASRYILGHLFYVSASQYTDFKSPKLLLTPALGFQFEPNLPGAFFVQAEMRWYAIHRLPIATNVNWVGPRGAIGATISAGRRFGVSP